MGTLAFVFQLVFDNVRRGLHSYLDVNLSIWKSWEFHVGMTVALLFIANLLLNLVVKTFLKLAA